MPGEWKNSRVVKVFTVSNIPDGHSPGKEEMGVVRFPQAEPTLFYLKHLARTQRLESGTQWLDCEGNRL